MFFDYATFYFFLIERPPRYNWNIVESAVKHRQANKQTNKQTT